MQTAINYFLVNAILEHTNDLTNITLSREETVIFAFQQTFHSN